MPGNSNNDGLQIFSVLGGLILENLTVLGLNNLKWCVVAVDHSSCGFGIFIYFISLQSTFVGLCLGAERLCRFWWCSGCPVWHFSGIQRDLPVSWMHLQKWLRHANFIIDQLRSLAFGRSRTHMEKYHLAGFCWNEHHELVDRSSKWCTERDNNILQGPKAIKK